MSGFSNNAQFGSVVMLYRLIGADMNSTEDQAFTKLHGYAAYSMLFIKAMNPSISLTTAAGGVYTGAAKTGISLITSAQVYNAASAAGKGFNLTNNFDTLGRITADPIFSLTTPQGAAATCDLYVLGFGVL